MSVVQQLIELIRQLFLWWFIVEPWEQAVRVRLGKHLRLVGAGIYFRVPFIDSVYKQNIRRRVCSIPLQTLTTKEGDTVVIHGSLGYKIVDVLKLHQTLHDAEASVLQEVMGLVTQHVVTHEMPDCTPAIICAHIDKTLDLEKYGLGDVDFFLSGYASRLPTVRLIQDYMSGAYGSSLTTQEPSGVPGSPR